MYFGLHIHHADMGTPWPLLKFGSWRLWDAYVSWPHLEPEKGVWKFELLDKYVALASQADVEIVLPLGLCPTWASARPAEPSAYKRPGFAAEPRDMENWRNYVRTVATRYKGKIHIYEIWNEPNLKGFFSGSADQMLDLTREAYSILKSIDPAVTIVSPSVTGDGKHLEWLDSYLAKGGGNFADVIGYHFYVQPRAPEAMKPLIQKVQSILAKHNINKPLWNTETGWVIASDEKTVDPARVNFSKDTPILSMTDAAAYVSRALIINWSCGVSRFYWYAWDSEAMGLIEPETKKMKKAAYAYQKTAQWLVGSTMTGCQVDNDKTWICGLTKKGERKAWLIWNELRERQFIVPEDMNVHEYESIVFDGVKPIRGGEKIIIGGSPLLLKDDKMPWNYAASGTK